MRGLLLAGVAALSVLSASAAQAQNVFDKLDFDNNCAVVLKTPDGFLALREEPRTQGKMVAKLYEGNTLELDFAHPVEYADKLTTWSSARTGPRGTDYLSGWVSNRYIRKFRCKRLEDLEHPFNCAWTTPPWEFENGKRIGAGLLNLREEPNSKSTIVTQLPSGTLLQLDRTKDFDNWRYVYSLVFTDGKPHKNRDFHGWVSEKYVRPFMCVDDSEDQSKGVSSPTPTEPPKTANANPINLPSAMIGGWCYSEGTEARQVYIRNDGICTGSEGVLTIWPDSYGGSGGTCTFNKIEKLAMNVYLVKSSCKGLPKGKYDGLTWTENVELQITNGQLKVISVPET
jgi:hypothetical protein